MERSFRIYMHESCAPSESSVGIDDEFPSDALVKFGVTLGRGIQGDHRRVDGFGDLDAVVQDRHHQAAVVLQHRGLAGEESVRLCPPETEMKAEIARRSLLKSDTITTAAPSSCADAAAARPTGPAPDTRTVDPVVTPALTQP
jgi:hypothetical protein